MMKFILFFALVAIANADPIRKNDGRVVGGEQIAIEEIPYQISIRNRKQHGCGGSIISEKHVITAAHCVSVAKIKNYSVRSGSENRDDGGSSHRVVKIMRHNFTMHLGMPINDIALVEVDPPFKFGNKCAPISLFQLKEEAIPGSVALVSGWGRTSKTSKPTYLEAVQVPMVSKQECKKVYKNLPDGQICAMHTLGGRDSCQGDSGGPLAINGRLAGIISWGYGCGVKGKPGVYTEVGYYSSWIAENTGF